MGFEVWQTGRDFPSQPLPAGRPGRAFRFTLPFNRGPLFYLTLNLRLLVFLLLHRTQYIWSVDMDTLVVGRIAGFLKRVPVIFDSHEFFSEVPELQHRTFKKRMWIWLEKRFIPGATHRFTVSPGLVELYKERYNCKFELLRNLPMRLEQDTQATRKPNSRKVIYQGSLNMGRGLAPSIQAMQHLPGYQLIIVGQGDTLTHLKALVKTLNLEKQVIFKGAVPFEELEKFNGDAMAGLCLLENKGLNYYHSLPNRIFDYMQRGIPVIASNFPDIRSVVKTHATGVLIDDLRPQTIAEAIQEASENQTLRLQWENTLPRAASLFTWEKEEDKIRRALGTI